jgi:hypothetical protein
MGAQAAAVLDSLAAAPGRAPRVGYLVSVRDARLGVADLAAGRDLEVRVRPLRCVPPLYSYAVRVTAADGAEVLHAVIGVFVPTGD